jgi:hypothetical protein
MKLTKEQVISYLNCDAKKSAEIADVISDGKTPIAIVDLPLLANDKLQILLRTEIIPQKELNDLALELDKSVEEFEPDPREQKIVNEKGELNSEPDKKIAKVKGSAWSAKRNAAWDAAMRKISELRNETWYVVRQNVLTTWCTAWNAEQDKQIGVVKKILEKLEEK